MSEYAYFSEVLLDDGTSKVLDLEAPGWADKAMLARVVRWSLLPKTNPGLPIVVVNIPKGAKPIFNSRVYGKIGLAGGEDLGKFRVYRIGYKQGSVHHWTWVLPNGSIESGTSDDSWLADLHMKALFPKG